MLENCKQEKVVGEKDPLPLKSSRYVRKKIALATGGTRGHIGPAEILAREWSLQGHNLLFLGKGLKTAFSSENHAFFSAKYPFCEIDSSNAIRKIPTTMMGIYQAFTALKGISCLVGFGSYHTFSTLIAARLRSLPYLLYEPNILPGKVNRLFARKASWICSPFPLNYPNGVLVDPLISLRKKRSCRKKGRSTLLIYGGSQGSSFLNQFFLEHGRKIQKRFGCTFIHIAGIHASLEDIKYRYKQEGVKAEVHDYVTDMQSLYDQVDVAVGRAGSGTLFELLFQEIPALFVPYPYGEKHQVANAQFAEALGVAKVCEQFGLTYEHFAKQLSDLLEGVSFAKARAFYKLPRKRTQDLLLEM